MAFWWFTEAIHVGATGLLPLAVFPVFGIATSMQVSTNYAKGTIWLLFGGFQLAYALEKTGLHKRIALACIRCTGTKLHLVILGFMLAVGCLSMFLSNTSVTLMILPMAQAVADAVEG